MRKKTMAWLAIAVAGWLSAPGIPRLVQAGTPITFMVASRGTTAVPQAMALSSMMAISLMNQTLGSPLAFMLPMPWGRTTLPQIKV